MARRPRADDRLQPLHQQARLLAHRIGRVTFTHVRREFNKEADRLANLAMGQQQETGLITAAMRPVPGPSRR